MKEIDYTSRQMMAFAFLADHDGGKSFSWNPEYPTLDVYKNYLQEDLQNNYTKLFADKVIIDTIGEWKCNHTPWLDLEEVLSREKHELKPYYQERNLTAVFESVDGTALVIAVAGTNFINNYDWFEEDVLVSDQCNWSPDIVNGACAENGNEGSISKGTVTALQRTWNILSDSRDPKSPTPITYLRSLLTATDSKVQIVYVTGHSLGGAIAPVLAKAIDDQQSAWGTSVHLKAYPFAGPTPGDLTFVNQFQSNTLGLVSFYNQNDVVPHAWQMNMVQEIPTLFDDLIPINNNDAIVKTAGIWLLRKTEGFVGDRAYTRWEKAINNSDVQETSESLDSPEKWGVIDKGLLDSAAFAFRSALIDGLNGDDENQIKARGAVDSICAYYKQDLNDCLLYFSKFLIVLGVEHINAYSTHFLPKEYRTRVKDLIGEPWYFDLTNLDEFKANISSGFSVLYELLIDLDGVHSFQKATSSTAVDN